MGAYPGAMELRNDMSRWVAYVRGPRGADRATPLEVTCRNGVIPIAALHCPPAYGSATATFTSLAWRRRAVASRPVRHRGRLDRPRAAAACEHVAQSLA